MGVVIESTSRGRLLEETVHSHGEEATHALSAEVDDGENLGDAACVEEGV